MLIRKLRADDTQAAVKLEEVSHLHDGGEGLKDKRLRRLFKQRSSSIESDQGYGIFDRDKLVGAIFFSEDKDQDRTALEIKSFLIDPDYRGRGAGKQLFESILAVVDTEADKPLSTLFVSANNKNAIGIYEGFGYKTDGSVQFSDQDNDYIEMERGSFAHIFE